MALHNWTGVVAILLTSFFMAPMFPTIFATGIKNLGAATKIGGSLLVMSVIGGAVFNYANGVDRDAHPEHRNSQPATSLTVTSASAS